MKKAMVFVLASAFILGLAGCSSNSIEKTRPIFETENISSIMFRGFFGEIEVPGEYISEIADWLGTFTIDQEVKDACLAPGSNGVAVRIEYADGTSVETGLTTIEVNGTSYYMKCEDAPECYLELTNGADD